MGSGTKVLVTGGKGFIGSWVVQELIDRGVPAVVWDLPGKAFVLPWVSRRAEVIEGDVAGFDPAAGGLLEGVKAVIHAAALTNVEKAQADPREAIRVNNLGTVQVLELCRTRGIRRVVYASSRGVLGHIDDEHGHPLYRPVDEGYRVRPHTIYGSTKLLSEGLGQNYARMHGLEFCSLRFAMIYGPGKRPTHGSGAFHSVLIEESLAGRPVEVPQGGAQGDDLIYVRDTARALVLAALAPALSSSLYHIGTGTAQTPPDFARALQAVIPQARVRIGPGLDYLGRGYQNYCVFDISRARKDLGYGPAYGLVDGIRDYLACLRRIQEAAEGGR